ncbi:MAG: molybdate ABC transporter substrate-binding protein [Marinicella sp.]
MNKVFMLLLTFLVLPPSHAEVVRVAVASNFVETIRKIGDEFNQNTEHELLISAASTGKLYAQITHGAPFDVFMSADTKTAEKLIHKQLADKNSLQTYAQGQLVMLSNLNNAATCEASLQSEELKHLAIANPKTAPYGLAAEQVLQNLGLFESLRDKLVMGENIAQTMQFVATKNAQIGLVAHSLVIKKGLDHDQCLWVIPANKYDDINQSMVTLNTSSNNLAVQAFLQYLKSEPAQNIIRSFGYNTL